MRHHGRGHLVRAAVEGVCQQLAVVLASVRDAGNEIREVRATGGFARSDAVAPDAHRRARAPTSASPRATRARPSAPRCWACRRSGLVESIEVAADLVQIDEVCHPGPDAARLRAPAAGVRRRSTTRSSRRSGRWGSRARAEPGPTAPPLRIALLGERLRALLGVLGGQDRLGDLGLALPHLVLRPVA